MIRYLTFLGLLLIASLGTLARADTPVVTMAVPLAIPNDASPRIFPAPDGSAVAYERAVRLNGHRDYYMCILEATPGSEPFCSLIPQQTPRGFEPDPNSTYFPISWSPDGTSIAVVGQPFLTQTDTDLLIYERSSDTWRNLTDDQYTGDLPADTTLEIQPAWSPDGLTIAAEQITLNANGEQSSALVLVDVQSGDMQTLAPLPGDIPASAGTVGGIAWSPDGAVLAISVLDRTPDPSRDGVWLVDIQTGEPRRLADFDSLQAAFQSVYADVPLLTLGALVWSPDGTQLLAWAGNPERTPVAAWALVVGAESGGVTPINLPILDNDRPDRRTLRPLQAAWSPDSRALLALSPGRDRSVDEKPLDSNNPAARMSLYLVDTTSNISSLLGHLPLSASVGLYPAAWGADGRVILNGYALQLSPER